MDTRSKIVTLAAALEIPVRPIAIAAGAFDILSASHARQLREVRESAGAAALLVVVLPLTDELLPQHARAKLVAALRTVDYVVPAGLADLPGLIQALAPARVVHLNDEPFRPAIK